MVDPYYRDDSVALYHGDALAVATELPDESVDCIVTSPPYFGLRDYGVEDQYGGEPSSSEYVDTMRTLFGELRRVLADTGTLWLNLGDTYATCSMSGKQGKDGQRAGRRHTAAGMPARREVPAKNLLGIPWKVAFALQEHGWILRNDIIWTKPNAMPESVADRLSNRHEHLFLLTKRPRYNFNLDAIREPQSDASITRARHNDWGGKDGWSEAYKGNPPKGLAQQSARNTEVGRNPGDTWDIAVTPFAGGHFATMPIKLAERCVRAGCKPNGTVLDPFSGSGTTGMAAARNGCRYVGIDLNRDYLDLSLRTRLAEPYLDIGAHDA